MEETRVLAFDIGASSGRAMLGIYDGKTINYNEIHRFSNDPVMVRGTLYWDVLRLFYEIKQGILKAKKFGEVSSIGVDTWGVDFGLLDKEGNLLENPIHYRDSRTLGMLAKSFDFVNEKEFYKITGNQFMEINTVFQLLSLSLKRKELFGNADTILMMPDLLNYMLTGVKASEYSIASTTQLLDAKNRIWSEEIIDALTLPKSLFTKIVPSGTPIGDLSKDICTELGVNTCKVIAVAGHDTQSAMVAVPSPVDDFIFISCGTWSLFGTELLDPLINEDTFRCNITNEGGFGNKISFLKNIIGLWLIQESKRQWSKEGKEYDFSELEEIAGQSKPFKCFIDPDANDFITTGDIPKRIQEYSKRTNQEVPETVAEITRCIYESLALKYRMTLEEIKKCTKKEYSSIHMVGGGTKSKLLCQFTADACNLEVIAGPVEATVLGNIAVQVLALGYIKDISEVREVISKDSNISKYEPVDARLWDEAYERFKAIKEGGQHA